LGKLSQALLHGAKVIAIEGNFDDALELAKGITSKYSITLVNSLNPDRIEGQKTAAFEICDILEASPDYQAMPVGDILETSPDYQAMPVGNAGNITAYWKGYREYKEKGKIKNLPKIWKYHCLLERLQRI